MKPHKIYDLPTRLFHWLFAGLFIAAYAIAQTVDDESTLFAYHMILGLIMAAVLLIRIVWGFIGSEYARFSSFELAPQKVIRYFKGILTGTSERSVGHNPASSWAAIVMMVVGVVLVGSGIQMALGSESEFFEEVHEIAGTVFVITAIAHVLGIVLHTIRHRDPIGMSMLTGSKMLPAGNEIQHPHRFAAIAMLVVVSAWTVSLLNAFDPATGTLPLFGSTLQLGESEEGEGKGEGAEGEKEQGEESGEHEEHDDD